MKVRELIFRLEAAGWEQVRQKGSHRIFKHPNVKDLLVVSGHKPSDDIPIGLAKKIMRQAGI